MKYNGDINSLGGIQDYHMIHEALRSNVCGETNLKERMIKDNIFGIRTEEGRGRFYRGIKSTILSFKNNNHSDIYHSFFNNIDNSLPYNFLIFWQLSLNNKLFRILTEQLYLKYYFNGKTTITGEDVNSFISHLKEIDAEFKALNWTKKTIGPIASKYLTILRKLGFLEGVQKKQLKHVQVSDNVLAVYLHLLKAAYPEANNILNHEFQPFSFIAPESFAERIKRVAQKGLIDMSYSGTSLSVQSKINFKDLANGIYN
ncbi:BrxA family protein [Saccharicrinis aurantiacus]|uniref:BrxA family protein n=1 Tax=Saccharicrinis aurantiacus TaxID=1849719 RepID=UPI00094FF499|nr:BrxA family protein [Saccharicrinis aurantiacus]